MRILITGANGQLGRDCTQLLSKQHTVETCDLPELDIADAKQVDALIRSFRPETVVNCAAYTAVDACETERETAWMANVDGPHNLAQSTKRQGGRLVHISTDYVFDGRLELGRSYQEDAALNPASFYGKTKAEAENQVRQASSDNLIVRTAWLYGRHGHNFLKTMLKLALADPDHEINVVDDQFGSPTWSYRLALQLGHMIMAGCKGTYHATAEGSCTWFELADQFLTLLDMPHRISPCTSAQYTVPAPRPKNAVLENKRLKLENLNQMQPWQSDLTLFVKKNGRKLINEAKAVLLPKTGTSQ
jgi:dTDP-4-dehydrorhamnose reductase